MEYLNFNVKTVPLVQGESNLVEASAGTGKTYSIAILVLRLLMENKIPINEILMVTFTKAAVAELQERIRKFVRDAHRYSNKEEIDDETIKSLVDNAIANTSREEIIRLLYSALINLDEISVLTIHSFCQQTLNEYAFETGQLFNAELITDTADIIDKEVKKFWRENITTLNTELLFELKGAGLSIEEIAGYLSKHLDGKEFLFLDKDEEYDLSEEKQEELLSNIDDSFNRIEETKNEIYDNLITNKESFKIKLDVAYAKNSFLPLIDNPEELVIKFREVLRKYRKDGGSKYVAGFPQLIEWVDTIDNSIEEYENTVIESLNYIYSYAILEISKGVKRYKTNHNVMSFDDLITNLNYALNGRENKKLEWLLQDQYKAVFIDEFQDTDKAQYEIFKTAFHGKSILFYIGDPKQSIYAWRKADIATYLQARKEVHHVYGMNKNYRSDADLIKALNRFLLPNKDFDTFGYEGAEKEDKIEYIEVEAFGKKEELQFNGKKVIPLTIGEKVSNPKKTKNTAIYVLDMLTNPDYRFYNPETGEERNVKTSDIGILVRTKKEAAGIKNALARYNIPAVEVTDVKILQSAEARDLVYILKAVENNTSANLNRALLTVFLNYSPEEILKLDEERLTEKFRNYKDKWKKDGVYAMMMEIISDFQIRERALGKQLKSSERSITNLFHLLELLYKTENRQNMNPSELIDWMEKNISLDSTAEDEWVQRIESDEEAVKIATIHASKGLEYNIVFAPFLDLIPYTSNNPLVDFKDSDGNYKVAKLEQLDPDRKELYLQESEQENMRLLYVAITRAVYRCHLESGSWHNYKNSSLKKLTKDVEFDDLIGEWTAPEEEPTHKYDPIIPGGQNFRQARNFSLSKPNWQRMSYSSLAADFEWTPAELFESNGNDYDEFIFKKLRRGTRTGNFIHEIFENVDFTQPESWEFTIQRQTEAYKSASDSDIDEFRASVGEMLNQVLNTDLASDQPESLKLSDVSKEKCIHELEFDFPVDTFSTRGIIDSLKDTADIKVRYLDNIEGIMTGFVDLFFEHNGKYYILDWKTNYLGPSVEDYSPEKLEEAMSDNNYHLQYLIYSVAIKKYLESRLGGSFDFDRDFGGVYYLFIRGMRNSSRSGIFYRNVKSKDIQQLENLISKMAVR